MVVIDNVVLLVMVIDSAILLVMVICSVVLLVVAIESVVLLVVVIDSVVQLVMVIVYGDLLSGVPPAVGQVQVQLLSLEEAVRADAGGQLGGRPTRLQADGRGV